LQSFQHGEVPTITINSPKQDSDETKDQCAPMFVYSEHSQRDQEIQQDQSGHQLHVQAVDKDVLSSKTNNRLPGIDRRTKSLGSSFCSPSPQLTQSFRHVRRTVPDVLEVGGTMGLLLIERSASHQQLNSQEEIPGVYYGDFAYVYRINRKFDRGLNLAVGKFNLQ